jgi:methyl-accepting chemotaxis protein
MAALSQGNPAGVGFAEHDFAALVMDLRASLDSAYSRSIRANLRDQLQSAVAAIPGVESRAQEVFTSAKTQDHASTSRLLRAALLSADQLRETIHQASVIKKSNLEFFKASHSEAMSRARIQFSWLVCLACAFGFVTSLAVARSFSRPLQQAILALNRIEQGDLTQQLEIDSKNEIGRLAQAMNAAFNNIRGVISEVSDASRGLTSASAQLAKSADIMASGAHEQAASLEQTSASLEQITATVRQNSDNARQASQFALSSRDAAEKGGTVVKNAIGAMDEINDASVKIAAIIRVIDEIAFQTNLLAVNASVEAARAREHGKGFAVVATEVRTLAQRSGGAAKEIKALISDSRRKVENGSSLVNRSGQTLTDIVASVKRVTDIVSEIAAASREQSVGIEQVNTAMLQMDAVMQSNSSQTEELSATANMLASNALQLERLIGRFVVNKDASAPSVPVVTPPLPEVPFRDPVAGTNADLTGLAANLGQQVSIAALDEEFEEF